MRLLAIPALTALLTVSAEAADIIGSTTGKRCQFFQIYKLMYLILARRFDAILLSRFRCCGCKHGRTDAYLLRNTFAGGCLLNQDPAIEELRQD